MEMAKFVPLTTSEQGADPGRLLVERSKQHGRVGDRADAGIGSKVRTS